MSDVCYKIERRPIDGGDIVIATLNRPKLMNAMNAKDAPDVVKQFDLLAKDPSVRCVVLTGAGKAFCAGADLSVAAQIFQGKMSPTAKGFDVACAIERLKVPVIGAINGPAITGGFEVALACDILLASPSAVFVDTHAQFGIHPCWGLSQKLQRLIGTVRANHYSLSALPITAKQAEQWGLVSQVLPAEELLPGAIKLAEQICRNHPKMVRQYKAVIRAGGAVPYGAARDLEREWGDKYYGSMTPDDFKAMQKFLMARKGTKKKKAKL